MSMVGSVGSETRIVLTMKQFIGGLISLIILGGAAVGVVWGLFSSSVGQMRDDVGKIREAMDGLRLINRDDVNRARDAEARLADQIGGLRTDLAGFTGRLDNVVSKLDTMTVSVNTLNTQIERYQFGLNRLSDPKSQAEFVESLKKQGLDLSNIVIVPLR